LPRDVKVTAHRGSSAAAPENTLAAVELAVFHRADFAEIDVQLTADGQVVVIHDADLMRVAGQNRQVSELTLAEIQQVDVGSWFAPEFASERIPTLEQVIATARGRLRLNIELKPKNNAVPLAERVVEVVEQEKFEAECVLSSLDDAPLEHIAKRNPALVIGKIVTASMGDPGRLDVHFLSLNEQRVTRDYVRRLHQRGKQVHVWTVNDPKRMGLMIDLGVDNLITDAPDVLVKLLEERAQLTNSQRILLGFRNWLAE
jgi:glycerophosphoryl diester phosphodiesterase